MIIGVSDDNIEYHSPVKFFKILLNIATVPDNEINNQCNNFDLTVKDGDLYVSTVWSSTKGKIEVGDKVIKINGKPTKKYDFCESILNGIPELKEKKQTKLTIETASGIKNIIYKKE